MKPQPHEIPGRCGLEEELRSGFDQNALLRRRPRQFLGIHAGRCLEPECAGTVAAQMLATAQTSTYSVLHEGPSPPMLLAKAAQVRIVVTLSEKLGQHALVVQRWVPVHQAAQGPQLADQFGIGHHVTQAQPR